MAANIHTHNFRQCSHASVGLAQAHPNYTIPDQIVKNFKAYDITLLHNQIVKQFKALRHHNITQSFIKL